jgi:ATP-binding cassette subfamily B protein
MRELPMLMILDEPTAAIDPQAEHDLFERFASLARIAARRSGTITILVSHRFSTVTMADDIVVIDDGRVMEHGAHRDLLAADGKYAELFRMQAKGYA